jgi:5-methylcytosine-specific restriction endonuclease McrA
MKTCRRCSQEKPDDAFRAGKRVCYRCRADIEREHRIADPEKYRQRDRDRYGRDREKRIRQSVDYAKAHREQTSARKQAWARSQPPLKRRYIAAKQRLTARNGGPLSAETLTLLPVVFNDPCAYCGCPAGELDHIDAFGSNEWDNLTSCCRSCNRSKHQRGVLQHLLARELRESRDYLNETLRLLDVAA